MSNARNQRLVMEQILRARARSAESCHLPDCVDARRQARRVPELLEKLIDLRRELVLQIRGRDMAREQYWLRLEDRDTDVVDLRGKVKALEAAQAALRAEQRREIEGYRAQLRDLRDAQHHAEHRAAGAESARDLGCEREKVLQARISVLEAQLRQAVSDNSRMRDRIDDLRHDLQLLLAARAAPPTADDFAWAQQEAPPSPRYPAVRAGVRRQAEINGAIRRAFACEAPIALPGRAA